jgi:hypothetical protein
MFAEKKAWVMEEMVKSRLTIQYMETQLTVEKNRLEQLKGAWDTYVLLENEQGKQMHPNHFRTEKPEGWDEAQQKHEPDKIALSNILNAENQQGLTVVNKEQSYHTA